MAKCKTCINRKTIDGGMWCDKVSDSYDVDVVRGCEHYKCMTNGDRIRKMTDEELADLLTDENFQTNVSNEFCGHLCKNSSTEGCLLNLEKEPCPYTEKDDMIEWLQSEVEE